MSKRSERYLEKKSGLAPGERLTGDAAVGAMLDLEREHTRPLAGRDAYSRTALALVEAAKEQMQEGVAEPEFVREFLASLRAGVRERDRTCMNIFPRLLGLLGEQKTLIIELWSSLGVKDEQDARAKILMAQSVEGMGPHDGADRCVEYLSAYLGAFPQQRAAVVRRLGGVTEVRSSDYTVMMDPIEEEC